MLSLRSLLHDEVPLRSAPRVERRLPAPDAARQGGELSPWQGQGPGPADHEDGRGRALREPAGGRERGERGQPLEAGPGGHGRGSGHSPRGEPAALRLEVDPSPPPEGLVSGRGAREGSGGRDRRRARRPGLGGPSGGGGAHPGPGGPVRHLLRKLERAPDRGGPRGRLRAQRDRGASRAVRALLRHAAPRARGSRVGREGEGSERPGAREARRRGFRRRGAGAFLRPHVQAGAPAHVSRGRSGGEGQGRRSSIPSNISPSVTGKDCCGPIFGIPWEPCRITPPVTSGCRTSAPRPATCSLWSRTPG